MRTAWCACFTVCWIPTAAAQELGDNFAQVPRLGGFTADRRIEWVEAPSQGELFPVQVNGHWGHTNDQGELVNYPEFDWADDSVQGMVRVVRDGFTFYAFTDIDRRPFGGTPVARPYPYADRFSEDYALVGDGERFGYIGLDGDFITPIVFEDGLRFKQGYAVVMLEGMCGIIDVRGEMIVPPVFASLRSFHNGYAAFKRPDTQDGTPGSVGYIDIIGRVQFEAPPGTIDELGDFNENYARARVGDQWGYLDTNFDWHIEPQYAGARDFTNGYAAVLVEDEGWGYIDVSNRFQIAPVFQSADDFDSILAMVQHEDKWGYIDQTGRVLIDFVFDEAEPVFRDYARGSLRELPGQTFYLDVSGRAVWHPLQALEGFVDRRIRQRFENEPTVLIVAPPPFREPLPAAYPPEFLYDEGLPRD